MSEELNAREARELQSIDRMHKEPRWWRERRKAAIRHHYSRLRQEAEQYRPASEALDLLHAMKGGARLLERFDLSDYRLEGTEKRVDPELVLRLWLLGFLKRLDDIVLPGYQPLCLTLSGQALVERFGRE